MQRLTQFHEHAIHLCPRTLARPGPQKNLNSMPVALDDQPIELLVCLIRRLCFSCTFEELVRDLRRLKAALGDGQKIVKPNEVTPIVKMSKKLVAARDLPADHKLTVADIAIKSPGDGLPPYELDNVVGKTLKVSMLEDEDFHFDGLE